MCTIHLFDGTNADTKDRHLQQIAEDWKTNRDGGSVLILDDHNEVVIRLQTTKLKHLLSCIKSSKGTKYVVHLRASTTSQTGVGGCHMFDSPSGEWIYCHNGIIHSSEAKLHRVDSIALGDELDDHSLLLIDDKEPITDLTGVLPDWQNHSFANVIAYNSAFAVLFVHRSHSGQLHTDGNGNWSTHRIDRNYSSVSAGWYGEDGTPIVQYPERTTPNYYRYFSDTWKDVPSIPSDDSEESLVSQDGQTYLKCDDCNTYEKSSDCFDFNGETLCPHCYAWNSRYTGKGLK